MHLQLTKCICDQYFCS